MWVVNFLPLWVFQLILAAGVAGLTASFMLQMIPLIKQYTVPLKIISSGLLCIGLWFLGAHSNNEAWVARVKEMEAKVVAAEQRAEKENVRIETQVVTKLQVVKVRGEDIIKYVDREVVKYDTKFAPGGICEIPKEFVDVHNKAAEVPRELIDMHNKAAGAKK